MGGNLVDASPAADTAPPLLALDAEVELASQDGTRRVPLADFFVGVRKTLRRPDELLTAVRCRCRRPPAAPARFHKLGLRKADAISVISAAVAVDVRRGRPLHGRPHRPGRGGPRAAARATAAEDVLLGQTLTPALIAEAARLAAEATRPIDDIRGSAAYRRRR